MPPGRIEAAQRLWSSLTGLGRAVLGLALLGALLALIFALDSCGAARTAKTTARISANQTEAALASGADAANTVGEASERAAASDLLTRENDRDIRQAPGADAPVTDAVHAAGLRALCSRAAYRGSEQCLQLAPAK